MKSTIIQQHTNKNVKFPLIAQLKQGEVVVMFTDVQTGIVLVAGTVWEVGYYATDWVSCMNSRHWRILDDVTINFKS